MGYKHADFRSRVQNGYYWSLECSKGRQGVEHVVKEYIAMAKEQVLERAFTEGWQGKEICVV